MSAKKVLVTPLDWGLGHATRCIPVIRELLARRCDVLLAGSGRSLELLRLEFPSLTFFELPGYNPEYSASGAMVWKMASQLPGFINTISAEHRVIEKLIREHGVDLVISDNRYGCWSKQVPSVFITHQSNILMPKRFGWLRYLVAGMNKKFLKKFTICWIPDFPEEHSLAGELISFGKTAGIRAAFIGSLSRFKPRGLAKKEFDIVVICSGPEPQRTIFENILTAQVEKVSLRSLLVRGVPGCTEIKQINGQSRVDFMGSESLQWAIEASGIIIARSGYSTLMDLCSLGKKAVFIPTPGQTEQEYLARRMKDKGIAFYMEQDSFALDVALDESGKYSGFPQWRGDHALLKKAIDDILAI